MRKDGINHDEERAEEGDEDIIEIRKMDKAS
jgi:hypothetical protein